MKRSGEDRPLPQEAIDELNQGRKIEAVKIVREQWGIGLKEALDVVEHHADGWSLPVMAASGAAFPGEAVVELMQGNKIAAIKIVRQQRGIGLKDARERVDAYIASQPALALQMSEVDSAMRRKGMAWFLLLAALFIAVFFASQQ